MLLSPDQIFAANHPANDAFGQFKREVILRDVYEFSLRQWRRVSSGQAEISRPLAMALLERYCALHAAALEAEGAFPCIGQELPDGSLLVRVRPADVPAALDLLKRI
jgi:hypothetical protein